MGKNRWLGYRYYLKKVDSDFINGKIYHRPSIKTKYWEEDTEPAKSLIDNKATGPKIIDNVTVVAGLYEEILNFRQG